MKDLAQFVPRTTNHQRGEAQPEILFLADRKIPVEISAGELNIPRSRNAKILSSVLSSPQMPKRSPLWN
jgi:hypothetical protein